MTFSIFDAGDVQKLLKKHRIAARMISDDIRRARKASDKHYERSQELIKCKKERDNYKQQYDFYLKACDLDSKIISGLKKDIKELKEELELNNLENAHLNGKIAAYEKILKIN